MKRIFSVIALAALGACPFFSAPASAQSKQAIQPGTYVGEMSGNTYTMTISSVDANGQLHGHMSIQTPGKPYNNDFVTQAGPDGLPKFGGEKNHFDSIQASGGNLSLHIFQDAAGQNWGSKWDKTVVLIKRP